MGDAASQQEECQNTGSPFPNDHSIHRALRTVLGTSQALERVCCCVAAPNGRKGLVCKMVLLKRARRNENINKNAIIQRKAQR